MKWFVYIYVELSLTLGPKFLTHKGTAVKIYPCCFELMLLLNLLRSSLRLWWRTNEHHTTYSPSNNDSIRRMYITENFPQLILQLTHSTDAVLCRKMRHSVGIAMHSSTKFICFLTANSKLFYCSWQAAVQLRETDLFYACFLEFFTDGKRRRKKLSFSVIIHNH